MTPSDSDTKSKMTYYKYESPENHLLTLYVKAGFDGRKYGACPFCQRIFMMLMLKVNEGAPLKFRVATVPSSRHPDEFKVQGLRNLPAIIHGNRVAIDTVEEIVDYIDSQFPGVDNNNYVNSVTTQPSSLQQPFNEQVDLLARNFFSKFCFYIKSVSRDSVALSSELKRLDAHLSKLDSKFFFGDTLTRFDCEVLPKLHHLRVAGKHLRDFVIPAEFAGVWRYLNNAYNTEIFQKACPPDQEIVLHWASRPDTPGLSYEDYSSLTRKTSVFSFDVPAVATPIQI